MVLQQRLLALLQAALTGKQIDETLFADMQSVDWLDLLDYASTQGVTAVSFMSFDQSAIRPPMDEFMEWLGQAEYIKSQYKEHVKAVHRLAELCKDIGADLLILKGISLTGLYPDPSVREFGDLDIFVMPDAFSSDSFSSVHKKVNEAVETRNVEVEYWDKHDVFNYGGAHVENHSYFVNKNSKSGRLMNKKLLEIVACDKGIKVSENVYYPTPDFNALFLLNHAIGHMSYEGATLKNVLDYGLFLLKDGDKVHWDKVSASLKETGWNVGFNTLTRVAEKVLAADFSRYFIGRPDDKLADKVLDNILDTTLHQEEGLPLAKRVVKKAQRLFSHKWMYSSVLIPASFWTEYVWDSLKEHMRRPKQF